MLLLFLGLAPKLYLFGPSLAVLGLLAAYQRRAVTTAAIVMIAVLFVALRFSPGDEKYKTAVTSAPSNFPVVFVVIMTDGRHVAHVVYASELDELEKQFTNWSFLVPEGEAGRMQREASSDGVNKTLTGKEIWFPSFTVSSAGPNRQRFEVYGSPDDDLMNRSWYVAESGRITPEFYANADRSRQMDSCLPFAMTIVIWLLVTSVVLFYVHRRTARTAPSR